MLAAGVDPVHRVQTIILQAMPRELRVVDNRDSAWVTRASDGFAKGFVPDLADLGCPHSVPLHPIRTIAERRIGMSLGITGLREGPVPDLVRIFYVDLKVRPQMVTNVRCKASHVIIAGIRRHVEPNVTANPISDFHEGLDRNPMVPLCVSHQWPISPIDLASSTCIGPIDRMPVLVVNCVCIHPTHETESMKVIDLVEKVWVKGETFLSECHLILSDHVQITKVVPVMCWIRRGE